MGGRKRVYFALNKQVEKLIDDRVTEEVGKRFMSVLGEIGDDSTTAVEDTMLALKYYATAKCMMLRMQDELVELHSYMATLDSLPEERRNRARATKLYEAKRERYENLEAEAYRLERWLSDIDYAISRLENEEQRRWIIGRYIQEKTDAEIDSNIAGISGRQTAKGYSPYHIDKAINTLKYYMFPMKALREDVLNIKGRKKVPKV